METIAVKRKEAASLKLLADVTVPNGNLSALAMVLQSPLAEVETAIADLEAADLLERLPVDGREETHFALACDIYERGLTALQARLVSYLRGCGLTEFPFVVKSGVWSEEEPVIAGTRLPVYTIVSALWCGQSFAEILDEYPSLTRDTLLEAVHYYLHHRAFFDDRLAREMDEGQVKSDEPGKVAA